MPRATKPKTSIIKYKTLNPQFKQEFELYVSR